MRFFRGHVGLTMATLIGVLSQATPATALDGGRYGPVRLATPAHDSRGYVVFFSDQNGWTTQDDKILASLSAEGAVVVGVDTKIYIDRIAREKKVCDQLVGDVESLSRQVQREHSGDQYQFPILMGIGAGGTLAGAVLAEAPSHTLSGAISLNPDATLKTAHPICSGAPMKSDGKRGFIYGPIKALSGFWLVAFTDAATRTARARIKEDKAGGTPLVLLNKKGAPETILADLLDPKLAVPEGGSTADLPLVDLPVAADVPVPGDSRGLMAVVLSGDGGWRDLDKTIAEQLQKQGVPVVGFDCLRYFWRQKTPEETANDLASVIETYSNKWHADKIALIGFSFGADVLPATYDLLPKPVQEHVVLVSLLAFESKADWEISVSGWLGAPPSDDAIPVGPAVSKMPGNVIQCIYGEDEEDTACPSLAGSGADVVKTSGGHHFDGDYSALAKLILAAFRERAAS